MSFDEMYDEMLHDEFRSRGASRGKHAAPETAGEGREGPRGLSRYRNAAMVGAGGLACAAVGAFLGGLGGYFTVNPAAAHSVASSSSSTPDRQLAAAVNQAYRASAQQSGSAAVAAASFSSLSGSLTQGIAPFQTLSYHSPVNLPVPALPLGAAGSTGGSGSGGTGGTGGTGTGGGTTTGGGTGTGSGCAASQSDLGLTCILDTLTGLLGNLGSLQGDPTGALNGLMPTLSSVVADVTGTLSNLSSLLPTSSLPLPDGGAPDGWAGVGDRVRAGIDRRADPGARAGCQRTRPGAERHRRRRGRVVGPDHALASRRCRCSSTGGSAPTLPSLPITTPGGSLPAPPTVGTPSAPSTGGGTNINIPLPSLPVPVNPPTINIGGISVGVSTGGSNSGLTLSLP